MKPKWKFMYFGGVFVCRENNAFVVGGKQRMETALRECMEDIISFCELGDQEIIDLKNYRAGGRVRFVIGGLTEEELERVIVFCDATFGERVRGFRRLLQ
jgi:ABC-type polysaccharide/polyol phosphate transport system ATPase subunit